MEEFFEVEKDDKPVPLVGVEGIAGMPEDGWSFGDEEFFWSTPAEFSLMATTRPPKYVPVWDDVLYAFELEADMQNIPAGAVVYVVKNKEPQAGDLVVVCGQPETSIALVPFNPEDPEPEHYGVVVDWR